MTKPRWTYRGERVAHLVAGETSECGIVKTSSHRLPLLDDERPKCAKCVAARDRCANTCDRCDADISQRHGTAKYCHPCVAKVRARRQRAEYYRASGVAPPATRRASGKRRAILDVGGEYSNADCYTTRRIVAQGPGWVEYERPGKLHCGRYRVSQEAFGRWAKDRVDSDIGIVEGGTYLSSRLNRRLVLSVVGTDVTYKNPNSRAGRIHESTVEDMQAWAFRRES